jgi:hypothetical protein
MNRLAKLCCWLAIAEMAAAAMVAIVVRWPDLAHHREHVSPMGWRLLVTLCIYPFWIGFAVLWAEHRLRLKGVQVSDDHRRLTETGTVAVGVLTAAAQTWLATIFISRDWYVLYGSPQQIVMLVSGALFMVLGNATAKVSPPKGPAAPDPGVWIRVSLREGWVLVLSGIVMIAAAFAPPHIRAIAMLAIMPGALMTFIARRRMWRRRPPQAPA